MNSKTFYSDFLVMGSGIAGLSFAIHASSAGTVNIVTKKREYDSNTNYAQGGIASVLDPDDTFEGHIEDTLVAGAGLCNRKAVDVLVHEGPDCIRELMEWGAEFSCTVNPDGTKALELGREGGHHRNRIVHAKDLTGREVERALLAKIKQIPNIRIFEGHTAVDLLTEHQLTKAPQGETCFGAYILDNATGDIDIFTAKATIIASGGAGSVYLYSTNPSITTGDGIAIAYRAGALIADMEFMQFHPTALFQKTSEGRSFLISEAVRGEGAILRNMKGERFMEGVHPLKELAPRDIVARAIDRELKKTGDSFVYLDISFKGKEFLQERFPQIYQHCLSQGIDIAKDPIPVVPVAHFLCGGIVTDLNARSSIRNLYAAGEAACTGVHGANRLASNSLLEALVFGRRAASDAAARLKKEGCYAGMPEFPVWDKEGTFDVEEWILIRHNVEDIKRLMWDYVGIVRTNLRLKRAYSRILFLKDEIRDYYRRSTVTPGLLELRNMSTIGRLIISGAMMREESRGLHYNTDYPESSDAMKRSIIQKSGAEPFFSEISSFDFSDTAAGKRR